jgi:adenine-specific DNA methylase
MHYGTLSALLEDTLLYGEYKGVSGYVDPYITKERFDRIQEIIQRNTRHHQVDDRVFIFSGMLRCPLCGSKLVGNYY